MANAFIQRRSGEDSSLWLHRAPRDGTQGVRASTSSFRPRACPGRLRRYLLGRPGKPGAAGRARLDRKAQEPVNVGRKYCEVSWTDPGVGGQVDDGDAVYAA